MKLIDKNELIVFQYTEDGEHLALDVQSCKLLFELLKKLPKAERDRIVVEDYENG